MALEKIRQYTLYLLIFTLPWQTRWIIRDPYLGGFPWEYGRISLYGWDIILILLFLISLPVMGRVLRYWWIGVQEFKMQKLKIKIFSDPLAFYFLLFLYILASILWSTDKLLTSVWSLRLLEGGILWLLVRALRPKLFAVCWSLVAAGTLQALWGIWQFLTQSTFANKWLGVATHPLSQGGTSVVMNEMGRWLRAYAGQVHPNVLGGLLVITLLATASLYLHSNTRTLEYKSRLFLLLLYIIQLIGLFFTFSRSAWLALFISIVWWWWRIKDDRQSLFKIFFLSGVVIITLVVIYWPLVSGRFYGISSLEQQSIADRRGSIKESKSLLSDNRLVGVGMGNYTAALIDSKPGLPTWRYQPVHNIFLLVLTELGTVGLILFLWLWLRCLNMKRFLIHNSLFIIPVIISSLFDHYWWTVPSMFLLFWLILILKPEPTVIT